MDPKKLEYNNLVKRFWAAVKYLDNESVNTQEKEKYLTAFREIVNRMNTLAVEMSIPEDKLLRGFGDEV